MKPKFMSFLLTISSLLFFFSCNDGLQPTVSNSVTYTVKASNELIGTKTHLSSDNSIDWVDGVDKLRVFETVDGVTVSVETNECVVDDEVGLFDFTLPEERFSDDGNYYDFFYPSSAWVSEHHDVSNMLLNLPSEQCPKNGSFDPDADILLAKTIHEELPDNFFIEVAFRRITAISKMSVKGLNTTDHIRSVKFSSENKNLSGHLSVNLPESRVLSYGADQAKDNVSAKYTELDAVTNGSTIVFTTFPAQIAENESFSVEIETSVTRYTKTFTIPAGRNLTFAAGDISTFSVDMTGAKEDPITSGDNNLFYIVAPYSGSYYAMTNNVIGGKRLDRKEVNVSGSKLSTSDDSDIIWIFEEQANGNFYISDGENYVSSTETKTISLGKEPVEFKLIHNANDTYRIENPAEANLQLRYNANKDQNYFAFYTSPTNALMIGDFLLIPASSSSPVTQLSTPTGLSASVDEADAQKINISWNTVTNATSYIVKCGDKTKEVNTTSVSFTELPISTYEISVCACANGYRTSEKATTSCVVTGVVGGSEELVFSKISVSKKSNTSVGVYVYGANFKTATSLKIYYSNGTLKNVNADISSDGSFASATITELSPDVEYTFYAQAVLADSSTIKSSSTKFTISASSSTASCGWLELPAQTNIAKTKQYTLKASGERNYSFLYDTYTRSSLWVAYPLAKGHMGSGRTDSWTYCPDIPKADQQKLSKGYSYTGEMVARGHQIANSDRNGIPEMQKQTFYFVNSTPQLQNKFNGYIWNSLEQAVQNVAQKDTVYVITGPVYQTVGGNESVDWNKAKDNNGVACPIPNYYFKVVMKVKRSAGSVSDAQAVGFWFEHKNYTDRDYTKYSKTVDEIEELTGFDFFTNLPDDLEAKAESNSDWSAFTKF